MTEDIRQKMGSASPCGFFPAGWPNIFPKGPGRHGQGQRTKTILTRITIFPFPPSLEEAKVDSPGQRPGSSESGEVALKGRNLRCGRPFRARTRRDCNPGLRPGLSTVASSRLWAESKELDAAPLPITPLPTWRRLLARLPGADILNLATDSRRGSQRITAGRASDRNLFRWVGWDR